MDIPPFLYPPIERHLGCFQVWVISNRAAVNTHALVFVLQLWLKRKTRDIKFASQIFCVNISVHFSRDAPKQHCLTI